MSAKSSAVSWRNEGTAMNTPITAASPAAITRNAGSGMNGHAAVSSQRAVSRSPIRPPARTKFSRLSRKNRNMANAAYIKTSLPRATRRSSSTSVSAVLVVILLSSQLRGRDEVFYSASYTPNWVMVGALNVSPMVLSSQIQSRDRSGAFA